MTANVNVTKLLFKRGNTVQNANYTGINGEITVDTQAKTLRIHDGVTAGGNVITAGGVVGAYSNTNAAAYIPTDSTITSLQSNAATQAIALNTVNANVGAFQNYANITLSTIANAASQESAINSINANVGAYQTFANANAASQTTEINSLRANITAANAAITSLQSNAAVQAALLDTLTGNAATQSQVLDTLTTNAATQATTLTTLLSNAVAQQTSLIDLVANAAAQAQQIANVTGTYSNTNVAAYLSAFDGNIIPAANVTYSLGDSTHQWKDLWVSNNTIYIGNTPIRVDGGTLLVNNAPVSGGSNIGNLQIDNNNNQLSFGPGESYSFLNMKNDGSETRLANDNGNVQISTTKQGTGGGTYYWNFDDTGNLTVPGNVISGTSHINFVANSSGDGYGFGTIELRPDTNAYEDSYLIIDPTYPSHIHIRAGGAQDNSLTELYLGGENSHFKVNNGLNPDVSIAANNYVWLFGTDGSLTFPTGGNVIFDSSSTSIIDGVTDINAVGTIGANVIQVLSDLTSFGASPAPRIYGFSSIATTGSAVNEGNISASGNLVTGRNAYVTGNVFAAQYNFANGVNILDTITGVTSISSVVNTSIWSDASGDYQYGTLDYSYAVNGNNGQFAIQYSFPLVYGNVDVNVGNVIASNVTTTNGIFWANGQAYSTGGGSYGNTEVAAYLPAYTGNLGAGRAQVTNAVDFMYGGFPYMGWQLSGSDTLKLRTNIASGDYTNDAIIVDRQSLAVNVVATLTAGNIVTTNGLFWANGVAFSTGGSYGNTQVAAYLLTYPSVNANLLNVTNGNVTTLVTNNLSTANAVITGGYATGLANISVTGNATVGNLIGTSSNTTIVAGNYSSTFDTVGNVVLPSAFVSGNATVMGIAPGYAPNRPAFRIYGSSSNNWTTSNINFKGSDIVVDYNQGNYFNSTTGVFTAPVAGLYSITLNARIGNNNGQNQIMVLKNGLTSAGNVAVMWECDTNTGTAVHYGVSSVMKLVAGDFLTANITVGNVQFDANDSWTVSYIG